MAQGKFRELWAFDFDGTLSPIVPDREAATLHPECRELLVDLVADPARRVVILSSRRLGDLVSRVPVPGLILGGESGLDWRMPDGTTRYQEGRLAQAMLRGRQSAAPLLERAAALPGVDIESKHWSATVHYRNLPREFSPRLQGILAELTECSQVELFFGPEAVDVRFLRGTDKAFGLQRLCRLRRWDPAQLRLVYAGDDENDATAMRWVLSLGGAVYAVGARAGVAAARVVPDPPALARALRPLLRRDPPAQPVSPRRGACDEGV